MAETAKDLIYSTKTYTNFAGLELPEVGQYNQTFSYPLLRIGTSAHKVNLVSGAPSIAVYTTSSDTSGTVQSVYINQVHTAETVGAGLCEALNVTLSSEVKMGAWANAICGKLDLGTNGFVYGLAGAICAELDMPNSVSARGTYCVYQAELNIPASAHWAGGGPCSFFALNVWGAGAATFDGAGFLFTLDGVSDTAAGLFDIANIACANTVFDATLKIRVLGVTYYIPLATDQGFV